jgi:hypothetical protein
MNKKQQLLPLYLKDTVVYDSGDNLNDLLKSFNNRTIPLFNWCSLNRLDLNLNKTYCMFVCKKHIKLTDLVVINQFEITVVQSFKLLGITIDNRLSFTTYELWALGLRVFFIIDINRSFSFVDFRMTDFTQKA